MTVSHRRNDRPDAPKVSTRHRWWRITALVIALLLVAPTVSYIRALTYPGSASFQMRTVDWIRGQAGGSAVVNAFENWYYSLHKPPNSAPAQGSLPSITSGPQAAVADGPAMLPRLAGVSALPGEATWQAGRADAKGRPAIYTGYFRPDPQRQSIVVGVAWIRSDAVVAHYVAGTREPSASWPGSAAVPAADVGNLVATFNSGFRMRDLTGGAYLGGRTAGTLRDGQASAVIDSAGRMTVGQWGRDVRMTGDTAAVRQNLHLVVDGGQPASGLTANAQGRWGSPRNQFQYTWRSALGVDARGNLLYVAGGQLNLATLATAMAKAGMVRGMQLDIHSGMTSFASWKSSPASAAPQPTKLMPGMTRSADRYLTADQRDFFYVTLR